MDSTKNAWQIGHSTLFQSTRLTSTATPHRGQTILTPERTFSTLIFEDINFWCPLGRRLAQVVGYVTYHGSGKHHRNYEVNDHEYLIQEWPSANLCNSLEFLQLLRTQTTLMREVFPRDLGLLTGGLATEQDFCVCCPNSLALVFALDQIPVKSQGTDKIKVRFVHLRKVGF